MGELILAHDLGTTGDKASLFDRTGRLVASAFSGYDTQYPRPGWAEQDPRDWWRAAREATHSLLAASGRGADEIAVVSFSGQMMGCLPVDNAGRPLRSAIIWADQRAEREAGLLCERVGAREVYEITGHRASSSYTAAKLLWIKHHQPELYRRTHRVLQAKDYLGYRLTGAYATDFSDASGTNLFDLARRAWSEGILQAMELDAALLPPAVPSSTVIGEVTREAAEATGLAPGTPVVIGGGDGACATVGAGVVHPSDAYNYIGSSSWLAFVTRDPLYDPQQRTFIFAHMDPEYVAPMGTMQCAGGSYDWLERLLRAEDAPPAYAELDELASRAEPGAGGLLFLPYLIGERSPHWNPQARGAFIGLSIAHGRAEMARAVLEGVALNLRIVLGAFREQGAQIPSLRVIGGGARSAVWRQILADVLALPLLRPKLLVEATSLGAAIAGGVGVGLCPGYGVSSQWVVVEEAEEPQPAAAAKYDAVYGAFCEAYRALEPTYRRIAAL